MIDRAMQAVRTRGWAGVVQAVKSRLVRERLRSFSLVEPLVCGKAGLEIGGPTRLFAKGGLLPIYPVLGSLDNGNFSSSTVWEGAIEEGATFVYDEDHAPGRQFILEATDLSGIPAESYDVVLSSHTLEHTANPLKALRQWVQRLRPDGVVVLVVPHKEGTFDHRRPVTLLAHLIEDERNDTEEGDLTHLDEILTFHDLSLDPPAGDHQAFKTRSERNLENRCLHHHVFTTPLAVEVVDHVGLQVLAVEPRLPHHVFVVARKLPAGVTPMNASFLASTADYRRRSPFLLDRA